VRSRRSAQPALIQLASGAAARRLRLRTMGRVYVAAAVAVLLTLAYLVLGAGTTSASYVLDALQAQDQQLQADQGQLQYESAMLHTPARRQQEAQQQKMVPVQPAGYVTGQSSPINLSASISAQPAGPSWWNFLGGVVAGVLGGVGPQRESA
jgi:cell division protein FtsL